jgi:hypothetical protein
MMTGQSMLYLPISPLIARQISYKKSIKTYGNGNSYFFKTDIFKRFLEDCIKEIGLELKYVPIKKYVSISFYL